jgi:large conductance mechanosensitive channel
MFKEFKKFVSQGNVFAMAVGIIIGAAFGKIVTSFVADILMPPIGLLIGGVDFTNLFVTLKGPSALTLAEAQAAGAVTVNYGVFAKVVLDFLFVAAALFMMIRTINRLQRPEPAAEPVAPQTRECPYCLTEIPIRATRCAHCTSDVTIAAAGAAAAAGVVDGGTI